MDDLNHQAGSARLLNMPGRRDQMLRTMLLCALTAAVFFLPFYLIDGGFFHYAGDFNSQQISFYRYMNGFIKGGGYPDGMAGAARNTFSWATDLGSGAMNAYSFYLYGSPFFWLSLIFPQNWLPYLMVPLLILKFAVAGGGAYRYLCRYVRRTDYAMLGACLYAFSGFSVYNVFFNHFVDVVALFPWMLWALDETLYEQEKHYGLFAFWVGVNLLNNYFFFIGQVIFLVIYFICKLTAGDFPMNLRLFARLAFESLLGAALACRAESAAEPAHHRSLVGMGLPDLLEGAAVSGHSAELDPAARLALYHLHLVGGHHQMDEYVRLPAPVQSGRRDGLLAGTAG